MKIPDASRPPTVMAAAMTERAQLGEHEFRVAEVPPGSMLRVGDLAVFNVDGAFCATQATCTHQQGPLNEGALNGSTVTCPWHGSQFNVCTGAVLRGPAKDPLETYPVIVEGDIARIKTKMKSPARTARQ